MLLDPFIKGLSRKAHPLLMLALTVGLLWGIYQIKVWLVDKTLALKTDLKNLEKLTEQFSPTLAELHYLKNLKDRDIRKLKEGLSGTAQAKKALYESGLALQEEKRLLEKQLEIMTTSLKVDLGAKKISLMREGHSLQDFPVLFKPTTFFGMDSKAFPPAIRIVSKERFAHPERGKFEVTNGTMTWNPPQVGTSIRSNALGEYVMFTNSDLILHGPPKKAAEHDSFTHACLTLSLDSARKLYKNSFIGTQLIFLAPSD